MSGLPCLDKVKLAICGWIVEIADLFFSYFHGQCSFYECCPCETFLCYKPVCVCLLLSKRRTKASPKNEPSAQCSEHSFKGCIIRCQLSPLMLFTPVEMGSSRAQLALAHSGFAKFALVLWASFLTALLGSASPVRHRVPCRWSWSKTYLPPSFLLWRCLWWYIVWNSH